MAFLMYEACDFSHSGSMRATQRAKSLLVSVISAAAIHLPAFFCSAEPGWIRNFMPRAPR